MEYNGDFDDYDGMMLEDIIEKQGKTKGLATFLAVGAVKMLEFNNWEYVRDFIYETLIDYIDE